MKDYSVSFLEKELASLKSQMRGWVFAGRDECDKHIVEFAKKITSIEIALEYIEAADGHSPKIISQLVCKYKNTPLE